MKIFVSYRSVNRPLVNELVADLQDMGHEVWYDQELEGGQKWWDSILQHVQDCEVLVFAMTPESLESYPCQLEYSYANALHKNILPVKLSENINYALLPVLLQERQIVDYVRRDKDAFKALSQALRNQPPLQALPDPLPVPPPVPISPLAPLKAQIDEPTLTYEEQVSILHQLKSHLHQEEYARDARLLLQRFSQHPTLLASILRDIQTALASSPQPQTSRSDRAPETPRPGSASTPHFPENDPEESGAFKADMLPHGEQLIKQQRVMCWQSRWVEKNLIITNLRLILNPVMLAVFDRSMTEIPLDQITLLEKSTKMLMPCIRMVTAQGAEYVILLGSSTSILYGNREELISLIQRLRP